MISATLWHLHLRIDPLYACRYLLTLGLISDCDQIKAQLGAAQDALAAAQAQIVTAQEATKGVEAVRDLLQQQLDATVAAATQPGPPLGDQLNVPQIPRLRSSSWLIQESMQVTPNKYADIQVCTVPSALLSSMCLI